MDKITNIIYTVFVMFCFTALALYTAHIWIPKDDEETKQPQVNQELIEIKRVGE